MSYAALLTKHGYGLSSAQSSRYQPAQSLDLLLLDTEGYDHIIMEQVCISFSFFLS